MENITLHNPRLIRERDLRIGDTVAVVRRGDVIPFAGRSLPEERDGTEVVIVPPEHCPSCDSELEVRGTGEERWSGCRHGRGRVSPPHDAGPGMTALFTRRAVMEALTGTAMCRLGLTEPDYVDPGSAGIGSSRIFRDEAPPA